jgi:hypothetical protein
MLNPEFRWLDPEPELLERLASLALPLPAGYENWPSADVLGSVARQAAGQLSRPGIHTEREITGTVRNLAVAAGWNRPDSLYYGWSQSLLENMLGRFQDPRVLLLAILDGDGIWAGCLAGVNRGGLDFLATFRFLWSDEPELASKQSLADLHDLCAAAAKRFSRPAGGLFIYKSEFQAWRDQQWSPELLQSFIQQQTAGLENL